MRRQGGHAPKKLERLAREWASGRSLSTDDDEFDDECRKFGVDPAALRWTDDAPTKERAVIWPDMRDSVALFFALSTKEAAEIGSRLWMSLHRSCLMP